MKGHESISHQKSIASSIKWPENMCYEGTDWGPKTTTDLPHLESNSVFGFFRFYHLWHLGRLQRRGSACPRSRQVQDGSVCLKWKLHQVCGIPSCVHWPYIRSLSFFTVFVQAYPSVKVVKRIKLPLQHASAANSKMAAGGFQKSPLPSIALSARIRQLVELIEDGWNSLKRSLNTVPRNKLCDLCCHPMAGMWIVGMV